MALSILYIFSLQSLNQPIIDNLEHSNQIPSLRPDPELSILVTQDGPFYLLTAGILINLYLQISELPFPRQIHRLAKGEQLVEKASMDLEPLTLVSGMDEPVSTRLLAFIQTDVLPHQSSGDLIAFPS